MATPLNGQWRRTNVAFLTWTPLQKQWPHGIPTRTSTLETRFTKIHRAFFLKQTYIYIWCCFLFGGWEGRRGEKSKKRLVRFISTEFWLWPMESWDHKMKDEDYEDDMFLECGSWKDLRSSWKYDEQGRSELMVKTTRERGRNNLTIWSLMISRFVPFWLRRKLFETLKIYTAEETEARQEALRLRMLFFCLGIWHGIFYDARWCTRTTSLLSAVKWILGVWNRLPEHLIWWNFKHFFFPICTPNYLEKIFTQFEELRVFNQGLVKNHPARHQRTDRFSSKPSDLEETMIQMCEDRHHASLRQGNGGGNLDFGRFQKQDTQHEMLFVYICIYTCNSMQSCN